MTTVKRHGELATWKKNMASGKRNIWVKLFCGNNQNFHFIVVVDGSWGQWSQWSMCSKTCGDGAQVRSRVCNDPKPAAGGATCVGGTSQEKYCRMRDCCKLMSCTY